MSSHSSNRTHWIHIVYTECYTAIHYSRCVTFTSTDIEKHVAQFQFCLLQLLLRNFWIEMFQSRCNSHIHAWREFRNTYYTLDEHCTARLLCDVHYIASHLLSKSQVCTFTRFSNQWTHGVITTMNDKSKQQSCSKSLHALDLCLKLLYTFHGNYLSISQYLQISTHHALYVNFTPSHGYYQGIWQFPTQLPKSRHV